MRVLFASTSGQGHVQPLLGLMRAFNSRGDDTLLVLAENAVASTLNSGLDVVPGTEPDARAAEELWSAFSTLPRREASILVERDWFAGLCLRAMLPDVERVVSDWRPDLVIRETCEYAGAVAADRAGIPHAQHGVSTAVAEESVVRNYAGVRLDEQSPGLSQRLLRQPYISRFPPSLDPSGYPTTLRYRGDDRHAPSPLPEWWPGSRAPLIYLTLGTVATGRPDGVAVLRAAIDAISSLDVRLLVTTGPSLEPVELGTVASNVHLEAWVDQVDAFEVASVVVCHGGSGTTYGALAAARPLVVLPMFADQRTNARLVTDAGAGLTIGSGEESSAANAAALVSQTDAIRRAVGTVLSTPSFASAARRLAGEISAQPSARELCDRLAAMAES